ncbi:WXG100 family type VII secretion target [Micromonospora sp. WMMD1120]|uniref:WXG100 family type VII secretion target n=1 Tax=Micromonospora sp. WMMD1120 TaxID=3016106 RepID=UPI0024178879|nr:WXG100 family type VII secretion target [Micromonospora sp. WMMD1120]MDG4809457.1 WXG100 family type VII secretion target [Micromonospora sp. WMMD1120]
MAITDITPQDIENAANNHDAAEQDLDGQRKGLDDTVNALYAANSGQLMEKLNTLQDQWSVDMRRVLDLLNDCEEYLRHCKTELERLNQDQGGALV